MKRVTVVFAAMLLAAAMPPEDAFDRAVVALAAGSRAADAGQPRALRIAALDLRASAAAPIEGEDLALRWLRQAHATAPSPDRDRALGPGYRSLALGGGGAVRFEQTFLAGQRARIAIVATRRADFALRVTDDDRATVCSASPDHARCDWIPTYTTRFRIEVQNPGAQAGRYFVILQ